MSIQYKTEGRCEFKTDTPDASTVAITWIKGDTVVTIHQDTAHIRMSKKQLSELVNALEAMIDDIDSDCRPVQRSK